MPIEVDLINQTSALLGEENKTRVRYLQPKYPACIFFMGEESARYYDKMRHDLFTVWGESSDCLLYCKGICNTVRGKKGATLALYDMSTRGTGGATLTPIAVQNAVTAMHQQQEIFSDMSRNAVFCVLDTTQIKNKAEFSRRYRSISQIRTIIGSNIISMLIVILDDAGQLKSSRFSREFLS
ncbi:MAG: hypothetical protein LBO81_02130, partial [Clostridiales Family XIII bacterium]|nr:hypothetical protein [Clostridiales Family XIII bacterium]